MFQYESRVTAITESRPTQLCWTDEVFMLLIHAWIVSDFQKWYWWNINLISTFSFVVSILVTLWCDLICKAPLPTSKTSINSWSLDFASFLVQSLIIPSLNQIIAHLLLHFYFPYPPPRKYNNSVVIITLNLSCTVHRQATEQLSTLFYVKQHY